MTRNKVTVTGRINPEKILKKLGKNTGKRVETIVIDDKTAASSGDDLDSGDSTIEASLVFDDWGQSIVFTMFSDENPNACSIIEDAICGKERRLFQFSVIGDRCSDRPALAVNRGAQRLSPISKENRGPKHPRRRKKCKEEDPPEFQPEDGEGVVSSTVGNLLESPSKLTLQIVPLSVAFPLKTLMMVGNSNFECCFVLVNKHA
uniref:Uncharacterized protein n=1 Tax=Nelumbo nucifera TaxID=4432 RepID=A0A822Y8G6_NELNU|nr:TPA_asm: hypothetical protein HUJ06_029821 [Nelumbo nucifera]